MIIKIIGSLIIVGSTTIAGFILGDIVKGRFDQLMELQKAINIIKNEIIYSFDVLENILLTTSKHVKGPVSEIFRRASEIIYAKEVDSVKEAFDKALEYVNHNLNKDDIEVIRTMATSIGNFDINGESELLNLTLINIERQLKESEELKNKNLKMYRSLGVCIGLIIVIFIF